MTTQQNKKDSSMKEKKPDESTGIVFSSTIKITEPKTGKVLLQKRAD